MRILVAGADGQLARKIAATRAPDLSVVASGRPELDIRRRDTIDRAIAEYLPDIVVNAAAYTAVDQAESEPEEALAVNRDGAANVAAATAAAGLPVIHISSDYVFSGEKDGEYEEDDETGPLGIYGLSKLDGERAVARENKRHVILRTAWVYSDTGSNFVRTMLGLAETRDEIEVVADQFGNPTSAADLAEGVLRVAGFLSGKNADCAYGIYHLAGSGQTSWAGFARHVFAVSCEVGGPYARVRDIATAGYPTKAPRPSNSRLRTNKFADRFDWRAPLWDKSAHEVVLQIVSGSR